MYVVTYEHPWSDVGGDYASPVTHALTDLTTFVDLCCNLSKRGIEFTVEERETDNENEQRQN
jgi:hypothetical protein